MRADRLQLEQILQNLIQNAIKFTAEGGRVVIRSELTDDAAVTITVSDTGCGIPSDHQQKVFLRFHRAPSETGADSGWRSRSSSLNFKAEKSGSKASPAEAAGFLCRCPAREKVAFPAP